MKAFRTPATWLAGLDAESLGVLLGAAADMAMVLDRDGFLRDFAFQSDTLAQDLAGQSEWLGRPWRDLVTIESRPKIDDMLRTAQKMTHLKTTSQPARQGRQVNFAGTGAHDVPVAFSVFTAGQGWIIAIGRDLREFASLQQRVVDVQQSFERDFARMRHIETRYRILFQMTPEPVLIIDLNGNAIIEANPAAQTMFGKRKLAGQRLNDVLAGGEAGIDGMLAELRASGRADEVPVRLPNGADMTGAALLFRQGSTQLMLLRLTHLAPAPDAQLPLPEGKATLLRLVERVPDGFVVTDHAGRVIAANDAFVEMTQLRGEAQAQGASLDRWIGRPGVDLGVLLGNLRQHGTVRLFATILRDEFGAATEVEISAGSVLSGKTPSYGFAIRATSRRAAVPAAAPKTFPKSLEQIIELIGRVSLKDLVREATDVIERLSIEAALEMTGNNRASAAEVLGVSRQSLYVKMRRHGLIEAETVGIE